jgi:beta-glucosidase
MESSGKNRLFPRDFIWGTATSSYQIEGGWLEGGKGLSIWDAFVHTPGKIHGGATGDVTCDHYHRFRDDVKLMADIGLKAYRFSISWPRIQPAGTGKPNQQGIRFYSELIDTLLDHGIAPWATLYHWDLPLVLHLEGDGWLDPAIAKHFEAYADICFEYFGDRVKNWITLNEPWVVAMLGYGQGAFAPGRVSTVWPYLAAHNLLRAHAHAVDVYRRRYQPSQGGRIGISNNCDWREPLTDTVDPIYRGDYPEVMRRQVGVRLPRFEAEDHYLIQDSSDFFGLNHYTTNYAARPKPGETTAQDVFSNGGIAEDQDVVLSGDPEWPQTTMGWNIVPWGCRKLLHWIDDRYNQPEIIITENGASFEDKLVGQRVNDSYRIDFLRGYLTACHEAIDAGVNLTGYFLWTLMDTFEWALGYSRKFGIHHVDFETLQRVPKDSALWYRDVIRLNGIPGEGG